MQWSSLESPKLNAAVMTRLARLAAETQPTSAVAAWRLGECLCQTRQFEEAAEWIAKSHALGCTEPRSYRALAECQLAIGRPDLVIEGWVGEPRVAETPTPAGLSFLRGMALMKLGRKAEARAAFERELCDHPASHGAAEATMKLALEEGDGALVLAACDRMPVNYQDTPVVRGYRALALSLLDSAEARTYFDYDDTVWLTEPAVPSGYPDISSFNATVAQEIRTNPYLHVATGESFAKTLRVGLPAEPATRALLPQLCGMIETYVRRMKAKGRLGDLPRLPTLGRLTLQANLVTASQPHRPHVHKHAVVSGVYYVEAPPTDLADPDAGCLVLGAIDGMAGQHQPAWPTRTIPAKPGTAVLFPPHMFHAVRATRSPKPRIAIAFDLEPAG